MKSFSERIKEEILQQEWSKREAEVFLYSFMKTNGKFNKLGQFVIKTTQKESIDLFRKLIEEYFEVKPLIWETKKLVKLIIRDKTFADKYGKKMAEINLSGDI